MAFDANGLKLLVPGADGGKLFLYTTTDSQAAVDTYFDTAAASDHIKKGDVVIVAWDTDGTPIGEIMICTASAAGAITMGAFEIAAT